MKKILCMGCSYTNHSPIYLPDNWEKQWPYILHEELSKIYTVETINGGVAGASIDSLFNQFLLLDKKFNPDIIIIQLTYYTRTSIGIDGLLEHINDLKIIEEKYDNYTHLNYQDCFNTSIRLNTGLLRRAIKKGTPDNEMMLQRFNNIISMTNTEMRHVLKFFGENVLTSTIHKQNQIKEIFALQELFKSRKKEYIFVNWPRYDNIEKSNILDINRFIGKLDSDHKKYNVQDWLSRNYGQNFVNEHTYDYGGHLDKMANTEIVKHYIIPEIPSQWLENDNV